MRFYFRLGSFNQRSSIYVEQASLALLATCLGRRLRFGPKTTRRNRKDNSPLTMNTEEIKAALVGEWVSIAPEIRPSANKNPDGTLKPFYLKRDFKCIAGDRFELAIINSADANG